MRQRSSTGRLGPCSPTSRHMALLGPAGVDVREDATSVTQGELHHRGFLPPLVDTRNGLQHADGPHQGALPSVLYHRMATHRGKRRAIVAVGHAIVLSACHLLSRNEPHQELGANYCDEHRRHQLLEQLARCMERLGYRVSFQPVTAL